MAQATHVRRQLERAGFEVEQSEYTPGSWYASKSNRAATQVVEWFDNDNGRVSYLNVRSASDHHDSQTDYHAGHYVDNVKQAIESAESSLASKLRWLEQHEARECGVAQGWKCPLCTREEREAGVVDLRSHVFSI